MCTLRDRLDIIKVHTGMMAMIRADMSDFHILKDCVCVCSKRDSRKLKVET